MKNAKTCLLPIGIFAALLCVLLFFSGRFIRAAADIRHGARRGYPAAGHLPRLELTGRANGRSKWTMCFPKMPR